MKAYCQVRIYITPKKFSQHLKNLGNYNGYFHNTRFNSAVHPSTKQVTTRYPTVAFYATHRLLCYVDPL